MLKLGAMGVAEASVAVLERTATDEGELKAEVALPPSDAPTPAQMNAKEKNSTRARHSPSKRRDGLKLLRAGPNDSILHPVPW